MPVDLLRAVLAVVDRETAFYRGTSFLLRRGDLALTAAHVVDGLEPERIGLLRSGMGMADAFRVEHLSLFRQCDLAVMRLRDSIANVEANPSEAFDHVAKPRIEEFQTCGWPDIQGGAAVQGVGNPRVQAGDIERVSYLIRENGEGYFAAELSLKLRPGISGAPAFRRSDPRVVLGLITASDRNERVLEVIEEERGDRLVERQLVEVSYTGYALVLHSVAAWLREKCDDPGVVA
jgi:Trypsin-like peptidase domain